jgi:hypothetical protein
MDGKQIEMFVVILMKVTIPSKKMTIGNGYWKFNGFRA